MSLNLNQYLERREILTQKPLGYCSALCLINNVFIFTKNRKSGINVGLFIEQKKKINQTLTTMAPIC